MFKYIHNRKGQAVAGEYVLVFFIAVAMVTGMSVFFRRAVQGRIYSARQHMFDTAYENTKDVYNGRFSYEYEPYYLNTQMNTAESSDITRNLLGGVERTFTKTTDSNSERTTASYITPPRDAGESYTEIEEEAANDD